MTSSEIEFEELKGIPVTPLGQNVRHVLQWRRRELMAAGFDELSAHRLARRADVDLHAVLSMNRRCASACACPRCAAVERAVKHA